MDSCLLMAYSKICSDGGWTNTLVYSIYPDSDLDPEYSIYPDSDLDPEYSIYPDSDLDPEPDQDPDPKPDCHLPGQDQPCRCTVPS